MEQIKEVLLALVLAGVFTILAIILKAEKQHIIATVASLVQKAEEVITGSGMGEEKKAIVIAQLEAAGIKVTDWVDKMIDEIVMQLNEKGGWFASQITAKK